MRTVTYLEHCVFALAKKLKSPNPGNFAKIGRAVVGRLSLQKRTKMNVVIKWRKKEVALPDEQAQVSLNPMERTLYRLFLAHPEGISADDLLLHWKELCEIYSKESCFDDPDIREAKLESLCGESKKVFYSTVSRIKGKFQQALGPWRAQAYIIMNEGGVYRTAAKE